MQQLIECVPNFSEGRDMSIIQQITDAIESVEGIKLLDVDPGKATNRTVVTFVGAPEDVVEAAFRGFEKAAEVIDMSQHSGEHPRMGATDVCPLIPIANISMEECAKWAHQLGQKVGKELHIPIYMYETAATISERQNLATIRAGEYEGFDKKIMNEEWKPDYGPQKMNFKAGVSAIGARDFLVAYNVNINTTSVRRANSIAFDVREKGRIKREGDPLNGKIVKDENGNPERTQGMCKSVKAIGWFIEEYGIAQISMNLTNISHTSLHEAFEACRTSANNRGMRVTGSELVGLVPLKVMLDAGKYFLQKQNRSLGIPEEEIIKIAVKSLGLDELSPFAPQKKIIEYQLKNSSQKLLANMSLIEFANKTASESPAPGGGSISAYAGALGAALGTMVANLSANKKAWDAKVSYYSEWAEKGQMLQKKLIELVDEDTAAFNGIIEAIRLPKSNDEEKALRKEAIKDATIHAIEVPFNVMETSFEAFELLETMANDGNPNSISDVGVGALCATAGIRGSYLNVKINAADVKEHAQVQDILKKAAQIESNALAIEKRILQKVEEKI